MKKLYFTIVTALFLSLPISQAKNTDLAKTTSIELTAEEKNDELVQRLLEIQEMDIKNLPRAEKRALRKEVKEIEGQLGLDNKVTISVGALIIIILLIIIIF